MKSHQVKRKRHGNTGRSNSIEQHWASRRNFAKRIICGMQANLSRLKDDEILLPVEQIDCASALDDINLMLELWNENNQKSKSKYLKVLPTIGEVTWYKIKN